MIRVKEKDPCDSNLQLNLKAGVQPKKLLWERLKLNNEWLKAERREAVDAAF